MTEAIKTQILIIGAGAMGRLWASHLNPASRVYFATRTPTAPAIAYPMIDIAGIYRSLEIPVWDAFVGRPNLILVMTKAQDAETALHPFEHLLSNHSPIVLFQNGMGSQQAIANRYPQCPVLAASTTEGAYIDDQGQLIHAGKGVTWVGTLNEAGRTCVDETVRQLGYSGLTIEPDEDIEARLWQKLAINSGINPFTAVLDCPNGEIEETDYFEQRIHAVCTEVSQLMSAHGRSVTPEALEARVRQVLRQTAANSSSMRQDVRAGRRTEIDMMNGFVASECQALGLTAPVNRELTSAVKALH